MEAPGPATRDGSSVGCLLFRPAIGRCELRLGGERWRSATCAELTSLPVLECYSSRHHFSTVEYSGIIFVSEGKQLF